jgi:hypothetical protein
VFFLLVPIGGKMLGDLIGELVGKRIVRRVLSSDPLKVEVTFEDSGKMSGVAVNGFGTYCSEVRADGVLSGEGQGAYISQEGELLSWKGNAQGGIKQGGAVSYRGILYYRTTSQKFARLNSVAGVFEYEIAPDGSTVGKVWEWK